MQNQGMIFTVRIEHCVNCHLHSWCSRHDPDKYLYNYQQTTKVLLQLAQEEHYKLIIEENQIPQHYTTNFFGTGNPYRKVSKQLLSLEMASGLIDKFYDTKTFQIVTFPKFGSFEIQVQGVLIFSKLITNKWPNFQKLKQTVKLMMIDHKNKINLQKYSIKQDQIQDKRQFRIRQQKQSINVSRQLSPKARLNNTIDVFAGTKSNRYTKRRFNYNKLEDEQTINPQIGQRLSKTKNRPQITQFYNPDTEKGYISPSTIKKLQQLRTKIRQLNSQHPNKNSKNVEVYLQPLYRKKRILRATLNQPQMNFTLDDDSDQFYKKNNIPEEKVHEQEIGIRPVNKKNRRLVPIINNDERVKSSKKQVSDYAQQFDRESSDLLGDENRMQNIQHIDLIQERSLDSNKNSRISEHQSVNNDKKQKLSKKLATQQQCQKQYQQLEQRLKKNQEQQQLKERIQQESKEKSQNKDEIKYRQEQIEKQQQNLQEIQFKQLNNQLSQQQSVNQDIENQQNKSEGVIITDYQQKHKQIEILKLQDEQDRQSHHEEQIQLQQQTKNEENEFAINDQEKQQLHEQQSGKQVSISKKQEIPVCQKITIIQKQQAIEQVWMDNLENIDWIGKFAGNQFIVIQKLKVQISKRNLKVVQSTQILQKQQNQISQNQSIYLQKKYNLPQENLIKDSFIQHKIQQKQIQQQQQFHHENSYYFRQKQFQEMQTVQWTAKFNFAKAESIDQSKYYIDNIKLWEIQNHSGNIFSREQHIRVQSQIKQENLKQQQRVETIEDKHLDFAETLQSIYWIGQFKQPSHKFVVKLTIQKF